MQGLPSTCPWLTSVMMQANGRIWYADGSTVDFCSRECWEEAPAHGVIAIAQPNLFHRPGAGDFYWMDPEGYVNCSNSPMALRARSERLKESIHVKYGETISYTEYKKLDGEVVEWVKANTEDCGCG